jgi:hypothetical protein
VPINGELTACDAFQTRQHSQQCGLATAWRTDENDELAIGYVNRHTMPDLDGTIRFAHPINRDDTQLPLL